MSVETAHGVTRRRRIWRALAVVTVLAALISSIGGVLAVLRGGGDEPGTRRATFTLLPASDGSTVLPIAVRRTDCEAIDWIDVDDDGGLFISIEVRVREVATGCDGTMRVEQRDAQLEHPLESRGVLGADYSAVGY